MPLVIPKSQLLNVPRQKKLFARDVMSHLVGQTVSKTIQFNGEASKRTVEIQSIFANGMLTTQFESGKPSGAQCLPKLLLFLGLLSAKTTGNRSRWIHGRTVGSGLLKSKKVKASSPQPSPPEEEREKIPGGFERGRGQ